MKRYLIFFCMVVAAFFTTSSGTSFVLAQQSPPMTEAHIQRIRSRCVEAQSVLNQLHASDALLRVNRGQLYESISTKLMTPLDGRIALNKLDGGNLLAIASQYERTLAAFRLHYQQYEELMTDTLGINCVNQPVAFYDKVAETREKRVAVHDSTVELLRLIQSYKAEFEVFATKFQETAR